MLTIRESSRNTVQIELLSPRTVLLWPAKAHDILLQIRMGEIGTNHRNKIQGQLEDGYNTCCQSFTWISKSLIHHVSHCTFIQLKHSTKRGKEKVHSSVTNIKKGKKETSQFKGKGGLTARVFMPSFPYFVQQQQIIFQDFKYLPFNETKIKWENTTKADTQILAILNRARIFCQHLFFSKIYFKINNNKFDHKSSHILLDYTMNKSNHSDKRVHTNFMAHLCQNLSRGLLCKSYTIPTFCWQRPKRLEIKSLMLCYNIL